MGFDRSVENITLRPAVVEDGEWAIPLLFSAGPALFSYIFASPDQQAQEVLQQAFTYPHHAFSYQYMQVVELQNQPAGVLIGYPGHIKRQADEKVQAVMARFLSLRQLPKILVNLADLSRIKQGVSSQDYYILSLSVLPELRSQGLGTFLLDCAETQARSQQCAAICLDVAFNNDRAKLLFERRGYQIICSKTTQRFQQMTRVGGLHRMTKPLT